MDNYNYTPIDTPKQKHSGLGIASLVIAIVSILLFCLGFGLAIYAAGSNPAAIENMANDSPLYLAVGLVICAGGVLNLIGLGLGIGGVFQADRNKTFSILGIIFNLLFMCAVGGLMVIGNLAP